VLLYLHATPAVVVKAATIAAVEERHEMFLDKGRRNNCGILYKNSLHNTRQHRLLKKKSRAFNGTINQQNQNHP